MKSRRLETPQRKSRSAQRGAVIMGVTLLIALGSVNESLAQRPFQRLRRNFDAIRPGWIIPHATEPSSSGQRKQASSKSKPEAAKPTTKTKKSNNAKQEEQQRPSDSKRTDEQSVETSGGAQPSPIDPAEDLTAFPKEAPAEFGATLRADGEEGDIVIVELEADGAANAAGLRTGDVIRSVGGITIGTVETLKSITDSLDSGVVVEFEISRDGKDVKKEVQFGTYQAEAQTVSEPTAATNSPINSSMPVPAVPLPDVGVTLPKAVPSPLLKLDPTPIETNVASNTSSNDSPGLRSVMKPTLAASPTPAPVVSEPQTDVPDPASGLLDLRTKKATKTRTQAATLKPAAASIEAKIPAVPKLDDALNRLLDLSSPE